MRGELRDALQIFQRGHRAQPRLVHILAAELDVEGVGRAERMRRVVAGLAGHLPGRGEQRFGEQAAAKLRQSRRPRVSLGTREPAFAGLRRRGCGEKPAEQERGEAANKWHAGLPER